MPNNKFNKFKIDFIGIGAPRSASTWIFECLTEHPEICGSRPKETKFFFYKNKKLKEYKKYFSHCHSKSIKGEYTPTYIYRKKAAEHIKKYFPHVKLIFCLRNPIDRLVSQYYFARSRRYEVDFDNLEERIKQDLRKYPDKEARYIEQSLYYKYISKYFELFPKEQILITIFEDIEKDPINFIKNIYKFLDVDPSFVPSIINKKINFMAENRRKFPIIAEIDSRLEKVLRNIGGKYLIKFLKLIGIKYIINKIRRYNLRDLKDKRLKEIQKELLGPETKKELLSLYQEDIQKLEKLISRSLRHWYN